MDEESGAQQTGFLMREEREVDPGRNQRMHRMKAHAASARIIDRRGQEVINIYEEPEQHHPESDQPAGAIECKGDRQWRGHV